MKDTSTLWGLVLAGAACVPDQGALTVSQLGSYDLEVSLKYSGNVSAAGSELQSTFIIGFVPTASAPVGCFQLTPSVVVTANGATLPNTQLGTAGGGVPFAGGTGCLPPEWRVPLASLDGGDLTVTFTDSSATVTTVLGNAAEPRRVTGLMPPLQGGVPQMLQWFPADDGVASLAVQYFTADGGMLWDMRGDALQHSGGAFTMTPPAGFGETSGTLFVGASGTMKVTSCVGVAGCRSELNASSMVPVSYQP